MRSWTDSLSQYQALTHPAEEADTCHPLKTMLVRPLLTNVKRNAPEMHADKSLVNDAQIHNVAWTENSLILWRVSGRKNGDIREG